MVKHCQECGSVFEKHSDYANHIRWKHRDNTESNKKISIAKKAKRVEEKVICSHSACSTVIDISYIESKRKKTYFCSRSCANSRGPRSTEVKRKISDSLKKSVWIKVCQYNNCAKEFETKRKSVKFCSKACGRQNRIKEKFGVDLYRSQASFTFNIYDYPLELDLDLVKKYGWYSAANRGNNLNGISRDHMYSVMEGYRNGIDPKLISHPANCKLLRHNENISKSDKCSITLDDLKGRISKWNKNYC